ncbi:MAG TPA: LiaF domain-containing protein [Kofleriaceae bacterium]|nr:LiaF domain-containing protein [Kofleriaceae bacterium]
MAQSLVALRDRREQVIARLSEGYAQDVFDVDELERRLDLAHGARSVAELDALVADISPAASPSTALVVAGPTAIDDPTRPDTKKVRVILSSVERRGRWSVPRQLDLHVLCGNAELDFRDASIGPGVTTIHVRVFMGNFEVVLPPNLGIDVDVSSFAGSVTERHRVPPDADPARPLIRIVGTVRFGNLEVTTRLPGESARDAYRREKRERKQLRKSDSKALPPGGAL